MDAKKVPVEPGTRHAQQVFPVFAKPIVTPISQLTSDQSAAAPKLPRPRKTGGYGRSTFFWVNANPQSVKGGSREEMLKRIRSHVMSEHNRKKRLENTRRYKSKAWKSLAYRPVDASAQSRLPTPPADSPPRDMVCSSESDDTQASSPENSVDLWQPTPRTTSTTIASLSPHHEEEEEANGYGAEFQVLNRQSSPESAVGIAPWSFVGQGVKDPFNSSQVQLTDRMFQHLQFFLLDLTKRAYPFQHRNQVRLQAHWASLVQNDSAPLHAAICSGATNKSIFSGAYFASSRWTNPFVIDGLHHKGETIRLVNKGLSNLMTASSDALIAAVSILITMEMVGGSPEHLQIHLGGLRRMVSLRSSFSDIAPDVRFQIEWTDVRVCLLALSKPIFPFVRYARPAHMPFLNTDKNGPMASRLLFLTEIPGLFGAGMIEAIYDLLELTQYTEQRNGETQNPPSPSEGEVEDYFNTEVLYVEYSLFSDRFTEAGHLKPDDTIEGCVRWACLLYHNTTIWEFYPMLASFFHRPIMALEEALQKSILTGQFFLCQDLLIWILFIAACSSKYLPQRSYFMDELKTAVRAEGLESFEEFRSLLGGFFYTDRCYLSPCREIWDDIQTPSTQG